MRVSEYLSVAHTTDRLPKNDVQADINPRLGLAGEIGSLLTQLKKEVRDNPQTADATKSAIKDELGDIIWYATAVAHRAGLDFQADVLFGNLDHLQRHHAQIDLLPAPIENNELNAGGHVYDELKRLGPTSVESFGRYQTLAVLTSKLRRNKVALVPYLVQIWKNAGQLLSSHLDRTNNKIPEDKRSVAKSLGDVMWYVAAFADLYGLSLDDVATENAAKIVSAFPSANQKIPTPLYDDGFPILEQFPRQFNVDFVPSGPGTTVMLIGGVRVGDPLKDNAYKKPGLDVAIDGYRFHDCIHLAFVAVLGWSPVMRSLLQRKRKSSPEVDDAEDGARARIVEEMIAKIAHSHAVGHDREKLFDEKNYLNLNLLKEFSQLANGLEVAGSREGYQACKFWEWESALLQGFRIYNQLRRNERGRVFVDLIKREVTFIALGDGQGMSMPLTTP